jgi:hypothetical protein
MVYGVCVATLAKASWLVKGVRKSQMHSPKQRRLHQMHFWVLWLVNRLESETEVVQKLYATIIPYYIGLAITVYVHCN